MSVLVPQDIHLLKCFVIVNTGSKREVFTESHAGVIDLTSLQEKKNIQ